MRRLLPAARSSTPGAQHDVGDVRGVGGRVDARLYHVQLDREVVAQQAAEVVGIDLLRRVEALRLHVLWVLVVEVVVDGEEQAARADRVEQPSDGILAGGLGQRRVLHRHEVERAHTERCLQGVPADPLDRGAGQPTGLPRPGYGDLGDVDRSDRPAAPSEPDASAPSPQPTSSTRPGVRSATSVTSRPFGRPLRISPSRSLYLLSHSEACAAAPNRWSPCPRSCIVRTVDR